jgi:hypothetical protein
LSKGSNAIVLVGVILTNSVEVKAGAIVCKTIVEMNN